MKESEKTTFLISTYDEKIADTCRRSVRVADEKA